jgi:hypothetical protein
MGFGSTKDTNSDNIFSVLFELRYETCFVYQTHPSCILSPIIPCECDLVWLKIPPRIIFFSRLFDLTQAPAWLVHKIIHYMFYLKYTVMWMGFKFTKDTTSIKKNFPGLFGLCHVNSTCYNIYYIIILHTVRSISNTMWMGFLLSEDTTS